MLKKFLWTRKLPGFKLKIFTRTKPIIDTYGTVLTSRASESTSGANGYNTECETTYKVFAN